jgi:hypothetical protein
VLRSPVAIANDRNSGRLYPFHNSLPLPDNPVYTGSDSNPFDSWR